MGMLKKSAVVALLVMMLGALFACAHNKEAQSARAEGEATPARAESPTPVASEAAGPLFTAYNVWFERPEALSCLNYQRGTLIPAGTRVKDVEARRNKITFTTEDGGPFTVTFNAKYHPGLSVEDFQNRMFTSKNFDQLTARMSPSEIACVKAGAIKAGVSKACVLVTFGYPPEHVTPSLDNNVWNYWENRFGEVAVTFNAEGRTTGEPEAVHNTRPRRGR